MASSEELSAKRQTDWSKCCLCHTSKKDEELKSPLTHYPCSAEHDGYSMIASNVPLFQAINQVSIIPSIYWDHTLCRALVFLAIGHNPGRVATPTQYTSMLALILPTSEG